MYVKLNFDFSTNPFSIYMKEKGEEVSIIWNCGISKLLIFMVFLTQNDENTWKMMRMFILIRRKKFLVKMSNYKSHRDKKKLL